MALHRFPWIGALLALLLSGCQPVQAPAGSTPTVAADVPAATTPTATADAAAATTATPAADTSAGLNDVTFTGLEYSFEGPESIPAGWTRITLENQGELGHDIQLFKLGEGKTMDDVMAALEAEGPPEWAEFYGSATAGAGESKWFAANLTPGNYVYLSFGESEEGPPDAAQGMLGTLTVTEAAGPVADDAPIDEDVAIDMVDYQFIINGTFEAGEQVLRVSNSGSEIHEVIFFKLNEGKTVGDFLTMMEQEMAAAPMPEEGETPEGETPEAGETPEGGEMSGDEEMPGEFAGGTFLSPGIVSYLTQEFETGTYVLVCFIPSPEHDMRPHAMLGMIQQVTVE